MPFVAQASNDLDVPMTLRIILHSSFDFLIELVAQPAIPSKDYPMAFAIKNAAVAASPPTTTVCHALRNGLAVVNRPLM